MIHFNQVSYTYPFQPETALRNLDLHVEAGETVLISGPSGSGKSTLGRLINGLIPFYFAGTLTGSAAIAGHDIRSLPFHEMTRLVGSLFQDPEQQFLSTTVEDELRTALEWRGYSEHRIRAELEPVVTRLGFGHKLSSSLFTLSEGEKQKVSLAAVLALKPKILMLDEPTANLDGNSTMELLELLTKLKQEGMTLVIFDHRLYWLKSLADKACLMANGTIREQGDFSILKRFQDIYGLRSSCPTPVDTPELPVCDDPTINDGIHFEGLSFSYTGEKPLFREFTGGIPRGRVIAVCGANGLGKTTLARLSMGLEKAGKGHIYLHGERLTAKERLKRSSLVLQNTELQLYMKTVEEELKSAIIDLREPPDIPSLLAEFHLSGLQLRHPQSLSGGERQRLVIACSLLKKPDVLILDEPTSGLDGRNMKRLGRRVRKEAERGVAIALITHDSELIQSSCDAIWSLIERRTK